MHKICPLPFTTLNCLESMSPCCPAWLNDNAFNVDIDYSRDTALYGWNVIFKHFKSSILNGSYYYCSKKCPVKISMDNDEFPSLDIFNPVIYNEVTSTNKHYYPPILNLSYDVTCNLACKSCRMSIIKTPNELVTNRFKYYLEMIHEAKELVIAGDGDAFASPHYFSLLQSDLTDIAPNLSKIKLQTNGILFTESNYRKIHDNNKKLITEISISIDAACEETYKNIRGADFNILCNNLKFIKTIRASSPFNIKMQSNYTISKHNISDVVSFIDFAYEYEFNEIQFWLVQNWGRGESFHTLIVNSGDITYDIYNNVQKKIISMSDKMTIRWMIK